MTGNWAWTRTPEIIFWILKKAFTEAPIHQHSKLWDLIFPQTEGSCFAITGILNVYDNFATRRVVKINSQIYIDAEQCYDMHCSELLANVMTMR